MSVLIGSQFLISTTARALVCESWKVCGGGICCILFAVLQVTILLLL